MNPSTASAQTTPTSTGSLYNASTGIMATPTASTTSAQTSAALAQGFKPATAIPVDGLGTQNKPITLPPAPTPTPSTTSVPPPQGSTVGTNGMVNATPPQTSNPSDMRSYINNLLMGDVTALGQEGTAKTTLEDQYNVYGKSNQAVADYNSYLQAKTDQTNTIAQMRQQSGGLTGGVDSAVLKYQQQSDAHISNLAIQANISQGLLDAANKAVTDKLDAQFSPIKDQVSVLNALSTSINNDMTDSEKTAATLKATQMQKEGDAVQGAASDIHQALLTAGAPASAYDAVDKITQSYINGDITASQAQSQMYAAASKYSTASSGGVLSNMPSVSMASDGAPDPASQAQFLAKLSPDVATLVQSIASYDINPNSISTRQYKGVGALNQSQILSLVKQYDPTYSEGLYTTRNTLRTNFASGKYSQNINALNTAVGHLADIPGNFAGLNNTGFTTYNAAKNFVAKTLGSGSVTSAATNLSASIGELATTFKGSGATDQEISNLGTIDINSSPAQQKAFVQTSINLLASRLNALQETYTAGMGKPPASSFLSPTNIQTLSNLKNQGYDVSIKGVYFTDPNAYLKASPDNATQLASVRQQYPNITPAQALQYAQYLQENGY